MVQLLKTVGETIVEYLEQLPVENLTAQDVWPPDATQDGIAAAIGRSRAHVALELKRLRAKRLVEVVATVHVKGGKLRRKVYRAVDPAQHAMYAREGGERIPLVRGELRSIDVVILRCPSCGHQSRVALES